MPSDHINDVVMQLYASGHRRLPAHIVKCIQEHLGVCELCANRFEQSVVRIPPPVTTVSSVHSVAQPRTTSVAIIDGEQSESDLPLSELILSIESGDSRANEELWATLYDELHRMAASQLAGDAPDQSLQPTVLVNEAYLSLVCKGSGKWHNRREFFAAAANAMRLIRVAEARKQATPMGNSGPDAQLSIITSNLRDPEEIPAINDALNRLEKLAPRQAAVVLMRYFGCLSVIDTAEVLGISPRTVDLDWRLARAWLHRELSGGEEAGSSSEEEARHWDRMAILFREAIGEQTGEYTASQDSKLSTDTAILVGARSLIEHDQNVSSDFLRIAEPPPLSHEIGHIEVADSMIGRDVDGYRIRMLIAVGGNGNVYEAVDDRTKDRVALKLLRHRINSQYALRHFEDESRILARLHHEHVARFRFAGTYHFGLAKLPYFAMEFVPGATTIIEYAAKLRLGIRARLRLFADVCTASAYMHSKGVVHRDLKPANILVNEAGSLKVIDFGVAHLIHRESAPTTQFTDAGYVVGTLQYMSPEQCEADPAGIDERSDVYSLGVILYQLLAGRLPYDVAGQSIHRAVRTIIEVVPTRPSDLSTSVDRTLDAIILRALSKDRNARYQSATELLHAIESWSIAV